MRLRRPPSCPVRDYTRERSLDVGGRTGFYGVGGTFEIVDLGG